MLSSSAVARVVSDATEEAVDVHAIAHAIVADLHAPRPVIFWLDLAASAIVGWGAFAIAVFGHSGVRALCVIVASVTLYRGLCFTHELTHLRRRALPGFETAWNVLFGVPLLLPSFTYIGVHQSHHNLSTYGTPADPEYLPFASSRTLIIKFAIQASLLTPIVLVVRFLLLAPVGLVLPRVHAWLETRASSFAMNPQYRRTVTPAMANKMRRWEIMLLSGWAVFGALIYQGAVPASAFFVWIGVLVLSSSLNTARVLAAHAYDGNGATRDRDGQLEDSIDIPGGLWTELWAPVGLRYHALHHYFPGIPYHNLGRAYRRIVGVLPPGSRYLDSTRPSLKYALAELYSKAAACRASAS